MSGSGLWFSKICLSVSLVLVSGYTPKVCVDDVCVIGKSEKGLQKAYDVFYGVPFAEPPIGDLRFKNPISKRNWRGEWDATYPRPQCLQPFSTEGSEDCLYLNIYRPSVNRRKSLPVLVFIHDGYTSFKTGSASPSFYGPEYIMDEQEVILVTIQYRLGIFGFLSSGDENCQGNFGLKDQNMALKWIRENIKKFGGDHHCITLAGHTAGASGVHYQIMSEKSDNLFHRAVLMSGTALVYWAINRKPADQFRGVAELANIPLFSTVGTHTIVHHLRTLSAASVLDLSTKVFEFHPSLGAFRPIIEGKWKGAFITDDPEHIWECGKFDQRPLLITFTAVEGAIISDIAFNETVLGFLNLDLNSAIMAGTEVPLTAAQLMNSFYFNNQPITLSNTMRLIDLDSDRAYLFPIYKTVKDYLQYANLKRNPVYLAKFDFNSTFSLVNAFTGSDINLGQSHMDDLMYLFKIKDHGMEFTGNSAESQMKQEMVDLIVSFAKSGHIPQSDVMQKCTIWNFIDDGFCEYVVFKRNTFHSPNSVEIEASHHFDQEMVKIHKQIDVLSNV